MEINPHHSTVLDAARAQCEIGVLSQCACHSAAQQSCSQVKQLPVSREGTDDDAVQMGKKLPTASQHLLQCWEDFSWDNYNFSIAADINAIGSTWAFIRVSWLLSSPFHSPTDPCWCRNQGSEQASRPTCIKTEKCSSSIYGAGQARWPPTGSPVWLVPIMEAHSKSWDFFWF